MNDEETKPITIFDVEYIVFSYAQKFLSHDEAIPDFHTRYPGKLESCLATPFQGFGGADLYPTFLEKSAILFYIMVKNHPFQNGNKRLAIAALLIFLLLNNKWLSASDDELYNFTKDVAKSDATKKDEELKSINQFIGNHIIQLEVSLDATKK
ncbi:MAG: type II toxin-antitoxin system death-on-curing family toxin [Hydrotalea sp.]|nr:type II toxin-antitoxin system death-on-curing family toxin [Hydrotalea sp.]